MTGGSPGRRRLAGLLVGVVFASGLGVGMLTGGRASGSITPTNTTPPRGPTRDDPPPTTAVTTETTAPVAPPAPPAPQPSGSENVAAAPSVGNTALLTVVSGTIRVRPPGAANYRDLVGGELIPLGSFVDALNGVVRITLAIDGAGTQQTAIVHSGVFQLRQLRAGRIIYGDMRLAGNLANCGTIAAAQRRERVRGRRLWGAARGRFRISGRRTAATVRGTIWHVRDACDGSTVTRVAEGSVRVFDRRLGRVVTVTAPGTYTAP